MKETKPDFFDKFVCTANNCVDNCCRAGWQIDIDNNTLNKYSMSNDILIKSVYENIQFADKKHCIKLNNGVCPFLTNDGLCQIVLKKGNSYLSDVCRCYPRFYNFLSDRTELGLGVSCVEVSKLLLLHTDKISFITTGKNHKISKNDEFLLQYRNKCIEIVQNRKLVFADRLDLLNKYIGKDVNFCWSDLKSIFEKLEYINQSNRKMLINGFDGKTGNFSESEIENIITYFLYRHLPNNRYVKIETRAFFCIFMTMFCDKIVGSLIASNLLDCKVKALSVLSKEIEYDNSNVQKILNYLEKI